MKTILETKFYDVKEVAAMFGFSGTAIRNFINDGTIQAKKFGKSWLISEEAVNDYFEKGKAVKAPIDNKIIEIAKAEIKFLKRYNKMAKGMEEMFELVKTPEQLAQYKSLSNKLEGYYEDYRKQISDKIYNENSI